jgi:hypothetical protein
LSLSYAGLNKKTLNTLHADKVIATWQYGEGWDESNPNYAGWARDWFRATILIEPPDVIREQYRNIEKLAHAEPHAVAPEEVTASAFASTGAHSDSPGARFEGR